MTQEGLRYCYFCGRIPTENEPTQCAKCGSTIVKIQLKSEVNI